MKRQYTVILASIVSIFLFSTSVNAQGNLWTNVSKDVLSNIETTNKSYTPANSVFYQLNLNSLKTSLTNAPLRGAGLTSNVVVEFPVEDGKLESFTIMEAPVLHPDLAARYPGIKSYVGKGIEDPTAVIRFSISNEKGLSSMILSGTRKAIFLDPITSDLTTYRTYEKSNSDTRNHTFNCLTDDVPYEFKKPSEKGNNNKDANDQTLRTFRLAMSGSGEYTAFHGGTKASALAAMNTTMTRVNGVYEVDFAINMVIIANNDDVIYTNAGSDPYTSNLNSQLQTALTGTIGEANYDIGHLVHQDNNNGNAGCIGCVCVNNQKGSGFTSHTSPQGDDFDIDFVAHEMGHQFGANHTHTYTGFSEGTGAQMEPGSGSSIMGYAGITGASSDVQAHSDDYFHFFNIQQVTNYVGTTSCQTTTSLTNAVPTVNAGADFTIPKGTAFILEGSGSDADAGDVLTYCWEQANMGFDASNGVSATSTSSPNFRSLPPTVSPDRYMPKLSSVIGGNLSTTWETVSNVGRTMNFALTVRDNVAGGGQNTIDQMVVTVNGAAGPFQVTSHGSNITYNAFDNATVTWNVAGTNTGAVNTPNVDILLSLDGGYTYPVTIATATANDGSETISIPNNATTSGKIMVRGSGNIFYALNGGNITINGLTNDYTLVPQTTTQTVCPTNNATYTIDIGTVGGYTDPTTLSTSGVPAGATANFSVNPVTPGNSSVLTISNTGAATPGNYTVTVIANSTSGQKTTDVTLTILDGSPATSVLSTPANSATGVASSVTFGWVAGSAGTLYDIDIATDAAFTSIIDNATGLTTNSYNSSALAPSNTYYWRVTANNTCATASASTTFSFTTSSCNTIASTDVGQDINVASFTSIINIASAGTITDVNVLNFLISHVYVGDVSATLTSPQGTVVQLFDGPGIPASTYGCNGDDINASFDDAAALTSADFENMCGGTAPAINGAFQSIDLLSSFNGELAAGNWTLTILDSWVASDHGTLDAWSLELCTSVPTGIKNTINNSLISIYPNPTENNITVDLGDEKVSTISLMDAQGKLVYQVDNNIQSQLTIDLSEYSKGIYMLKVESESTSNVYKVFKK